MLAGWDGSGAQQHRLQADVSANCAPALVLVACPGRRGARGRITTLPSSLTRLRSVFPQSSADQGETKSAQPNPPSKMIPPKQPMYPMPPQASSPYPGLGSFLSPSDLQSYRGHPHPSLPRTLPSKPMLPSISASPPPAFQISPPLHQQLSLHHPQSSLLSQPLSMQQVPQQPLLSPPMALQVQPPMNSSPPGQQVSARPAMRLTKRRSGSLRCVGSVGPCVVWGCWVQMLSPLA